jgi:DNA-binding CsgD family transcriptional regulator
LIIEYELISSSFDFYMNEIKHRCPHGQMMILQEDHQDERGPAPGWVSFRSHKDLVEKFQVFFFEPFHVQETEYEKSVLSDREIEVLKRVAQGLSNKEIAESLYISANTVITHRKNITDKLGIKTIAGLTVYAIMNQIVDPGKVNR